MQFAEIFIAILLFILLVVTLGFMISFKRYKLAKVRVGIEEHTFSIEEYKVEQKQKRKKGLAIEIILGFLLVISSVIFITSMSLISPKLNKNSVVVSIQSESMALVDSSNTYIQENNVENKIYKYDICKFNKVNSLDDINLYDIILYRSSINNKQVLIAHRVIKINEDNTFEVRGDANKESDKTDLTFNDIIGVYEKRLAFPSFVNYLVYTPGFYVFYVGCIAVIATSLYFEQKEKKLLN